MECSLNVEVDLSTEYSRLLLCPGDAGEMPAVPGSNLIFYDELCFLLLRCFCSAKFMKYDKDERLIDSGNDLRTMREVLGRRNHG
jgi:hypothetical protein